MTNDAGNHWTLVRKVLTYILRVWMLGEKRLQGGKVWKQEAMLNTKVHKMSHSVQ